MPFGLELIIIAVMLLFNAVFAAYEMCLASISRARIAVLIEERKKGADAAAYMKDRMEASLAVVQLGITLVGAVAAATGGAGAHETISPALRSAGISDAWAEILSLVCIIIPLSCFTIIFGELVPKVFAIQNKELVALTLSPGIKIFSHVVYPIVTLFERAVKRIIGFGKSKLDLEDQEEQSLHELRAAANLARSSKLIGAHEEKIMISATRLSERDIASVMISASDMVMIPVSSTLEEALVKAHLDMHTRFPVCERENDPQSILGYVNFKDIVLALKVNPGDPTTRGITRPIRSFDEAAQVSKVLPQMIHEKIHIALVTAKGKGVTGLVTLEDIIEELVGEIEDEYDRMPSYIHPYGTSWIMGGGVPVYIIAEKMGKDPQKFRGESTAVTLNDWLHAKLGRVPVGGDMIEEEGIRVIVRKIRRKKVSEALICKV